MAEEGPQQGDSDIVVEEEVEENMEMDDPPNVDAPAPIPDKAVPETSEPEAEDDHQSHVLEESTDQSRGKHGNGWTPQRRCTRSHSG